MKQLTTLLFILNCCVLTTSAQQFSFKVVTKGFADSEKIYLSKYHGRDEILIDSVAGSGQKEFKIETQLPLRGLYFIHSSKNALAELIVSAKEKPIVEVEKESLTEGKISISGSMENKAYTDFVETYFRYDMVFNVLAAERYDEFDPKYVTKLQARSKKMDIAQEELNMALGLAKSLYPNTYVSDVLIPLIYLSGWADGNNQNSYDNYHAFAFRHFWDNVKLDADEVLNHFLLNEMLKNYFRHFVPKNQDSLKVAIDIVLDKSSDNPKVYEHVKAFLLRNFLNSNASDLSLYVMNKGDGESCGLNLSEKELKKLEALKGLEIGAGIPDAFLPDVDLQNIRLSDVYASNKVTAILFWTGHCGVCRVELPELKKIHAEYKPQGFEVYAINLDENKFAWREASEEFNLNWLNVTDNVPLRDSKVLVDFNVTKTPQLFLVDNAGIILSKNKFGDALIKELGKSLSK